MKPKISVSMSVYNNYVLLKNALKSLQNQTQEQVIRNRPDAVSGLRTLP